jgi:hypothetical protein
VPVQLQRKAVDDVLTLPTQADPISISFSQIPNVPEIETGPQQSGDFGILRNEDIESDTGWVK